MPSQVDIIRRHIDDALARGGRALVGGPVPEGARFVQPTVLVDVPEDSAAVQEETFGPTVTVSRVASMDEAIERANGTRYALGSTVFSKEHGMEIAERLRAGMTAINGVISFAGIPTLPFGGVGDSGFGRIHGPDGLREFTYPHAIARQRFKPAIALTTFRRTAKEEQQAHEGGAGALRPREEVAPPASAITRSPPSTVARPMCSPSSRPAHSRLSTGWPSCTWLTCAIGPSARPRYQAKKPRYMLTTAR
nr:aldehyde dehydrogenase family protein [Nocardioides convexus]